MGARAGRPVARAALAVLVLLTGCAQQPSPGSTSGAVPPSAAGAAGRSVTAPTSAGTEWDVLRADLAAAETRLATAEAQGWWSGPICSPDIELHRENAGQPPLPDDQLRARCAANIGEFRASGDAYDAFQALDAAARAAETIRVASLLALPAGQQPTVGQIVVVQGCEQGWITDPADCAGIPTP